MAFVVDCVKVDSQESYTCGHLHLLLFFVRVLFTTLKLLSFGRIESLMDLIGSKYDTLVVFLGVCVAVPRRGRCVVVQRDSRQVHFQGKRRLGNRLLQQLVCLTSFQEFTAFDVGNNTLRYVFQASTSNTVLLDIIQVFTAF